MNSAVAAPSGELTAAKLHARLADLQQRIDAAAARSGRSGDSISIQCVTKTHPPSTVQAAYAAGLRDFGENYVQEALGKQDELSSRAEAFPMPDARWHLIGHLQSNKTNSVAGRFSLIESVASLKIAQRIGRSAENLGTPQEILIQVKLGEEETKSGVAPQEVQNLVDELENVPGARLLGLMAIAPLGADGFLIKEPRSYFAQVKSIFDKLPSQCRQVLSMGMSADFECAIEEGSTCIRVGTTLLGKRPAQTDASEYPG